MALLLKDIFRKIHLNNELMAQKGSYTFFCPKRLLMCQLEMPLPTEVRQEGSKVLKLSMQPFYKLQQSF